MAAEDSRTGTGRDFRAYVCPITNVEAFRYLGSILTATDDDFPDIFANLRKAWKKWVRMSRILGR